MLKGKMVETNRVKMFNNISKYSIIEVLSQLDDGFIDEILSEKILFII